MIPLVYNFPYFSIFLCMISAIIISVIKNGKIVYRWTVLVCIVCQALSFCTLVYLHKNNTWFSFTMGKFSAPFGNEIAATELQSFLATLFSIVMLCAIIGGKDDLFHDVADGKMGLAMVMMNMTLASLLVLIYTNDIFTGYVFIEISTIAACALVMIRNDKETLISTIRYLFMSLMGSGLFLFGIVILYSVTGHLLIPQLSEMITKLYFEGENVVQITAAAILITVGLGIKSGMYPFHRWLPWAHGSATTSSSAILSSLVLKGYIAFLITIYTRVFTLEVIRATHINYVVFALGVSGMIIASIYATKESHIKHLLAYSSVAQIGYIYMGIGLGTKEGIVAACFQMGAHAVTKCLLFISAGRLDSVTDYNKELSALKGSAYRAPLAGIGFSVGALSMIGIPLFAGFSAKVNFALAVSDWKSILVLLALAVSSILNAIYYIPAAISIWSTSDVTVTWEYEKKDTLYGIAAVLLIIAVIVFGTKYVDFMSIIDNGLRIMIGE